MKSNALNFLGAFLLVVAISAGTYFYIANENDAEAQTKASVASATAQQPATQPQSAGLQVQGGQEQPTAPALPTPDQFGVYEQYANEATALFIDIVEGTGEPVQTGDRVAMLYAGYLTNGTQFDATRSNENNELTPFVFELGSGQVISGWDQAIVGMKKDGQRRLIIPSSAGYGPAGQGSIPPDAMLIFDVQLVDVAAQ